MRQPVVKVTQRRAVSVLSASPYRLDVVSHDVEVSRDWGYAADSARQGLAQLRLRPIDGLFAPCALVPDSRTRHGLASL